MEEEPLIIDVNDVLYEGEANPIGEIEYEDFLKEAEPDYQPK